MITRALLVLRKLATPIALGYTVLLIVLSLISVKGMPSFGTDYDDKFYHFAAYFVLMILWYIAIGRSSNRKRVFSIALGCIAFGIIIEAIQGKITVSRVGDLLDVIANVVGVILATVIILRRKRPLS